MHTLTISKLQARLNELNETKNCVFNVVFDANHCGAYHDENGELVSGVLAACFDFQHWSAQAAINEIVLDDIKALEVAIAHFEKEQLINRALDLIA